MKNRIIPLLLAAVLVAVCASSLFITDASARTYNTDVWSGRIFPAQTASGVVSSDLMSADGVNVLLRSRTDAFTVPIKLSSSDGVISGVMGASATGVTGSGEWVTLSLSDTNLSLTNTPERTVTLTVTPKASYEQDGVTYDPPEVLTFRVEWRGSSGTIFADFSIDNRESRTSNDGATITSPSEYYLKSEPMYFTLNSNATLRYGSPQSDFPAGTRYSFGGAEYYLFDADVINTVGAGELAIDLSSTAATGTVNVSVGSTTYSVLQLTPVSSDYTGAVLLTGSSASVDLGLPYDFAEASPSVSIYRFTRQNGTGAWTAVSSAYVNVTDRSGSAYITTEAAPPGTYRIDISWTVNGHVIYSERIPFFVVRPLYGQN